jgi:NAD(P)H dehydrogenase (quinone)
MSDLMVAVVGAAGQTGVAALEELGRRGVRTRALVHRSGQAGTVEAAGASEVLPIELDDPASLDRAFDRADAVLHVPPVFDSSEPERVTAVVRAVRAAGVARFVFHSVMQPFTPGVRHHERKARSEAVVRTSGLRWTILQPAMYMQTVKLYLRLSPEGAMFFPYSLETPFTPIDLSDLAEITATVLLDPAHEYATYEIGGRELLTTREMAATLAAIEGLELEARVGTLAELALPPSWSEEARTDMAAMCRHYDAVGLFGGHRVAEMLLGRPTTSFAEALAR